MKIECNLQVIVQDDSSAANQRLSTKILNKYEFEFITESVNGFDIDIKYSKCCSYCVLCVL